MQTFKPSTRHEHKVARKQQWERTTAERALFERQHPVLSGAVKIVTYTPPKGSYTPAPRTMRQVDSLSDVH